MAAVIGGVGGPILSYEILTQSRPSFETLLIILCKRNCSTLGRSAPESPIHLIRTNVAIKSVRPLRLPIYLVMHGFVQPVLHFLFRRVAQRNATILDHCTNCFNLYINFKLYTLSSDKYAVTFAVALV